MILSVSRRTDIPGCYPEWFMNRLRDKYVMTRNPMNFHQVSQINLSPDFIECIVFWTKNAVPFMDYLEELNRMGYMYMFQYTITPYDNTLEKNISDKSDIIKNVLELSEKIEKKLNMLNKYFIIEEDDTANVVVRVYPTKQKIEVTIPTKYAVLRAEVVHDDLYAAIDLAVDKLEDQIRRQKTRLTRKNKTKLAEAFVDHELLGDEYDESDDEVVRTKTIDPDLMDLDEAIMRMEMLGHSFFIYRDEETRSIAVVYKRHDGGYGLIETE